jgi:hypothetical protein
MSAGNPTRARWIRFGAVVLGLTVLWFSMGKLLMEFDWQDVTDVSTVPAEIRRAVAEGRTGPQLKADPCMMHQASIDLDLQLDGPFPVGVGRDIIMKIDVLSDALMVDRVYLGPPTRRVVLTGLPVCLSGPDVALQDSDPEARARLSVVFYDLDGRRFNNFTGEDGFPVLAWRRMRVDWSVMPWRMPGTESLSHIMVTPL